MSGRQFKSGHDQLVRRNGVTFIVEREGQAHKARGLRHSDKRVIAFPGETDIQVGDVVRSETPGFEATITEIDPHIITDVLVSLQAHYETPAQQSQRLAAEQQRATVITIGTIQSSIVNIQTQLEHATQSIGLLPDTTAKAELTQLVAQLKDELQKAPADQAEAAEMVAKRVEAALNEAAKQKPDKELVSFSLESLQKAATNLATVLPTVLPVAMDIANRIRLLMGG